MSLYALSTFFFFLRKRKHCFFFVFFLFLFLFFIFWWRKNNTKRNSVKGEIKEQGGCGFAGTWTFCRRREKRGWNLPGGLIFFQLRGKIFLCRDSILLNSFYNVIIKNKKFGHFKARRRNQISFNIFSLLLLAYACHCMITLSFPLF